MNCNSKKPSGHQVLNDETTIVSFKNVNLGALMYLGVPRAFRRVITVGI